MEADSRWREFLDVAVNYDRGIQQIRLYAGIAINGEREAPRPHCAEGAERRSRWMSGTRYARDCVPTAVLNSSVNLVSRFRSAQAGKHRPRKSPAVGLLTDRPP
ncbi:MAG: hypothetical protein J2P48_08650 [Alphaproteobacteria bacterium]|nr:hypothetical protein [Alphaproteobacteria bacterium]